MTNNQHSKSKTIPERTLPVNKLFFVFLILICSNLTFGQDEFLIKVKYPDCFNCASANIEMNSFDKENYKLSDIKRIFEQISYKSDIEFNSPEGSCQQRAQIMSMLLMKDHKIKHARVWLFAPTNLMANNTQHLEITDNSGFNKGAVIKWLYHVAPVVRVKISDGKYENYVFDPSLNRKEPLLLSDWFKRMKNSENSGYTFTSSEKYFYNTTNNRFNGFFYNFEGYAFNELTMEKGLAMNDTAVFVFNKYITPLKDSARPEDKQKISDLKVLFGNINNLEYLVSENLTSFRLDNLKPRTIDNFNHRKIMSDYGDIVVEARNLFQQRTLFWTEKVNDLTK